MDNYKKMKKWLVLLTVIIILSLVVDLFYLNALYDIAEKNIGLRGQLGELQPADPGLNEYSIIAIDPIIYPAELDTTDLSSEALECVAENCDSELECVKGGYSKWAECIELCKETENRKNWMLAATQYCYSLYGANATRPLNMVKFNECLAPYIAEFRKALENTPGYTYYENCALVYCKGKGADAQNDCLLGRSTCILACEEMYPGSTLEEPSNPPEKTIWWWTYKEYASSDSSSSYYAS